jgi:hypothetical protein
MNNKIGNKLGFNIYVWINFCLFIFLILYLIILYFAINSNFRILPQGFDNFVIIGFIIAILLQLFDYFIKLTYFEAKFTNGQIIIKTFSPNKNIRIRFLSLLNYNKRLTELIIDRQFYNSYKISIDRFGFRKNLILQKIDNGKIYESSPINISFFGTKKYTDLILSIDSLKEKLIMN